jgi:hypothetical protein
VRFAYCIQFGRKSKQYERSSGSTGPSSTIANPAQVAIALNAATVGMNQFG